MKEHYDIIAIGNPLMDVEITISEQQFSDLKLIKNSMTLVPKSVREEYLAQFPEVQKHSSGGSVANTLYDLAKMDEALNGSTGSNNFALALAGFIADDDLGKSYRNELKKAGVDFLLPPLAGENDHTGTSIIFVTPDAKRTMRTTLGCASTLLRDKIDFNVFERAKLIYLEGYILNSPNNLAVVREIVASIRRRDILLAISCSDAFCVLNEPAIFKELLQEADIFFANEEEAKAILSYPRDKEIPLKDLVEEISRYPQRKASALKVITASEKGSYLIKSGEIVHLPAKKVNVVDTTGAGDAFAAGILYGWFKDFSLREMGELATKWASQVITKLGARV